MGWRKEFEVGYVWESFELKEMEGQETENLPIFQKRNSGLHQNHSVE
jgi:hypothetical protein